MFIEKLADYLDSLATEPHKKQFAICCRVSEFIYDYDVNYRCINAWVNILMAQWPKHSGDDLYPVPHPTMSPCDAWCDVNNTDRWDPETEYGRNRRELCAYLATRLRDDLNH